MRRSRSTPARATSTSAGVPAINPNAKVPAIVDGDATVFDSSAILLYLAREDRQVPAGQDRQGARRAAVVDVLRGVRRRPVFGQSVHFRIYAPEKIPYAINRYAYEAQRHFGIINERLAKQKYMLGDTYTIVDMNVWGWARAHPDARSARRAGSNSRTSSASSTRSTARPGRAARRRAQGQAQVQDRDGRRGEERDVQAPPPPPPPPPPPLP